MRIDGDEGEGGESKLVQKVVTENGITLLVHSDPRFHSVAYAVCLLGGLSDETPETVGITHFLEHLLFKRTSHQTTQEIACAIDELGGDVNAFTDFDSMCLFGTVPASRTIRLMDFISELLLCCAFDDHDLEVEREVIEGLNWGQRNAILLAFLVDSGMESAMGRARFVFSSK